MSHDETKERELEPRQLADGETLEAGTLPASAAATEAGTLSADQLGSTNDESRDAGVDDEEDTDTTPNVILSSDPAFAKQGFHPLEVAYLGQHRIKLPPIEVQLEGFHLKPREAAALKESWPQYKTPKALGEK